MTGRQRIARVRRQYNQWVGNQTLEDYALRFTAHEARRWSLFRVSNTALGAISFLACEAIGGALTLAYGFDNTVMAIAVVGVLIFLTGLPISYTASKYGVDVDLLTRGAGFGYIGSTITSLIYAAFTFLLFSVEAVIMALALEMWFAMPLWVAYIICALVVIPIVTYGIRLISGLQVWTQPIWLVLQIAPLAYIGFSDAPALRDWTAFVGAEQNAGGFNLILFGLAASTLLSFAPQIGEQADYLRFLPSPKPEGGLRARLLWWAALLPSGPGWIFIGAIKLLAGSFLAVLALRHGVAVEHAAEPTQLFRGRLRGDVALAPDRHRADRHPGDHLPDQDQRHQRLCRVDRLVELLLAPDPQPSRPRGLGGVQRAAGPAADGARHLLGDREDPRPLFQLRRRLDRRAGGRPGHQQAAWPQPQGNRVPPRPSL